MLRALSTTVCPFPAPAAAILDRWRSLAGEAIPALAVDGRLPPEAQVELLQVCRAARLRCVEITHPRLGRHHRRAASPLSPERSERKAAIEQIAATLHLGREHDSGRVVLLGGSLNLSRSRALQVARHARGLPSGAAELGEERQGPAAVALDHLSLVLDKVLPLCADLSMQLLLPVPLPWPDQVPDAAEAGQLLQVFEGAPLGLCYGTDWAHLHLSLRGEDPLPATAFGRLASIRVADAAGLRQRLPPGTGEVRFAQLLHGNWEVDQVLAPGPDLRADELAPALELLEGLAAAQPPPATEAPKS